MKKVTKKLENLRVWLIDLLGGYTREEIFHQRALFEEVTKERNRFKEQLELIESDLKNSDDNSNIEIISRHLILAMDKVKNREFRIFGNYEYDCDNSILAICRDFEQLLINRKNGIYRKFYIENVKEYQKHFLEEYQFFKTIEWKKKENIQFEAGLNFNEKG